MQWAKWLILVGLILSPGWMVFDGTRALMVGDYVTPKTGPHACQLGPWSHLVAAVGIEPRSSPMKWIIVGYGRVTLAAGIGFLSGMRSAWAGLLALLVLGLWYIPLARSFIWF